MKQNIFSLSSIQWYNRRQIETFYLCQSIWLFLGYLIVSVSRQSKSPKLRIINFKDDFPLPSTFDSKNCGRRGYQQLQPTVIFYIICYCGTVFTWLWDRGGSNIFNKFLDPDQSWETKYLQELWCAGILEQHRLGPTRTFRKHFLFNLFTDDLVQLYKWQNF